MTAKQAIVVFTRTPELGAVKTRLHKRLGEAGALALHCELVERLLAQVTTLDQDKFLWVTRLNATVLEWGRDFGLEVCQQTGADLGARMAAVFMALFAKGYNDVVLVGTDCPTIDAEYLQTAFSALASSDVVFGPAEDGGYGLVAVRRQRVTQDQVAALFNDMAWSTDRVLSTSQAKAQAMDLSVGILEKIWDVDTPDDVTRYWAWRLDRDND